MNRVLEKFGLDRQSMHHRTGLSHAPLALYDALYGADPYSFLYESLEGSEKRGRYSFVGGKPFAVFRSRGHRIEIETQDRKEILKGDPLSVLRGLIKSCNHWPPVGSFSGGAVGYIAYDAVRLLEKLPDRNPDELGLPDLYFIFPSEMIVLDHQDHSMDLIVYSGSDARERIQDLQARIRMCDSAMPDFSFRPMHAPPVLKSNMSRETFCSCVSKAQEYILAGDIFQVVLSQRFHFKQSASSGSIYRALRLSNPSPYMYFLRLNGLEILGSSPEILAKSTRGMAALRPLAGTRPRGKTSGQDRDLEQELLSDEKERAEHIMLVDLARNDMGSVCEYGSVQVSELFVVERYSKVMHLVSLVEGRLRPSCDSIDLLRASFPAGTVSGAPKIRSMEIIDELEPVRRGVYAGAIGYLGFNGDMDMCIAIRNILLKDGQGYLQAGAGIVADSVPQREYEETFNKARALMQAVEWAGGAA
ncbi:anthranilate synthase component I [bacterium]|nr:anthranilate synthase component I [bacterium]